MDPETDRDGMGVVLPALLRREDVLSICVRAKPAQSKVALVMRGTFGPIMRVVMARGCLFSEPCTVKAGLAAVGFLLQAPFHLGISDRRMKVTSPRSNGRRLMRHPL